MQITVLYITDVGPIYSSTKKTFDYCKSYSQKVTSNFTKEIITDEDKHIATEEGFFAFHTIKHNHSFGSMDCTSAVIRNPHVQKFSCGRTNCEAIVVNVLPLLPCNKF
jgi:hypothetical protein